VAFSFVNPPHQNGPFSLPIPPSIVAFPWEIKQKIYLGNDCAQNWAIPTKAGKINQWKYLII